MPVDLNKRPGCHLVGGFSASGGTGNDIEVLLFTQKNYREWEYRMRKAFNGEPGVVSSLYRSGRVSESTFDLPLPDSDTYNLVFNNNFSSFIWKDVKIMVYFSWL